MVISDLITDLNKSCSVFFTESDFRFHHKSAFTIVSTGNLSSEAYNWRKGVHNSVNAIRWFDDFWVYSEGNINGSSIQLSLSIFQGQANDIKKSQLIRAEWDEYPENNGPHPQPHWHVVSNVAIENTFEKFAETFEEDDFLSTLNSEKDKVIDIGKFHFSMCANWLHSNYDLNEIDHSKIVNWYCGLFSEIRTQLEFCKK